MPTNDINLAPNHHPTLLTKNLFVAVTLKKQKPKKKKKKKLRLTFPIANLFLEDPTSILMSFDN